jgi:putative flippase GtrA
MPEDLSTTLEMPLGARVRNRVRHTHVRVRHGVRHPENWLQLLRFGAVGASGFVVNVAAFWVCVHALSVDYRLASVIAWFTAVMNNFWLNRHWTFSAKECHPGQQAVRFLAVSLVAFGFQYFVLVQLVGTGLDKVIAQALSVIAAMPVNFIGQKLWTFKA